MDVVIDTSALLAVVIGEPERLRLISLTAGHSLIGPGAIPWEVGNAFSAILKRGRLSLDGVKAGLRSFTAIQIRYVNVDIQSALSIANEAGIYAYDAYFLSCAIRYAAPLITLDKRLINIAKSMRIQVWEI